MTAYSISLTSFEGSLDHLIQLIQKKEVDPGEIDLQEITHPFLQLIKEGLSANFDKGADFILLASHVALLKSKYLLPRREEGLGEALDFEEDPKFDIIHHLIDYCRFKEAAGLFSQMEVCQEDHHTRGIIDEERRPPLGLSGVSLGELGALFQDILKKAALQVGQIYEEEYRVQDKIHFLRDKLKNRQCLSFISLFEAITSKMEMIVLFLATLELVKMGEIKLVKQEGEILLYG